MAKLRRTPRQSAPRERVMVVYPKNLRKTLANLPWLVSEWDQLGFEGRYDAASTWDSDIQALELTARQYLAGELPEAEQVEYAALLAEVGAALPLAVRIGLRGPELPPEHPTIVEGTPIPKVMGGAQCLSI